MKELEELQVSRQVGRNRSLPNSGGGHGIRSMQLSPQNNQENPSHQKLAGLHLEKYSFPVEMMICLPNGTVVGTLTQTPRGPGSNQQGPWMCRLHWVSGLALPLPGCKASSWSLT